MASERKDVKGIQGELVTLLTLGCGRSREWAYSFLALQDGDFI